MQAVILAAGKGSRLKPLTQTTPKPLIHIGGTPLIERALKALPSEVDVLLIVVNYLRDQIIDHLGASYQGIPITYVIQEPLSGTAGALHVLKNELQDRFLVLNSDDLYDPQDLQELVRHERALLVDETHRELKAAAQIQDRRFTGLGPGSRAVCGAYVLGTEFFDVAPVEIQVSKHREFGLPQTLAKIADRKPITAVEATNWQQVGTPEQLELARKSALSE